MLRLAGSVEQVSPHVLASAIVREARRRGQTLVLPGSIEELPGSGVAGGRRGPRESRSGRPTFAIRRRTRRTGFDR